MNTKEPLSVLIADDEDTMQGLLERILSKEGFAVDTASSRDEALQKLETKAVDLIILDINMPGMSKFDLLKVIRAKYPGISIVMMAALGDTYSVKDALLLGADEFVTRPFKSHEIVLVVERAYWRIISNREREIGAT